jgi:hypothetical protein
VPTFKLSVATALFAGFAFSAFAAEPVSQQTPPPDHCTKTVGTLGAVMGHSTETAPDGRPIYRFQVRTNGLDYEALCDAKSGLVSDVVPRATH